MATQAGLETLRAGGSAVDAAIATNAALAVVAGHSCGLGGDAFWLIWDGERVHSLNGSGASAAGATLAAAASAGLAEMPERGPWTVTVPGAVHSWGEAHSRFGRLPWSDLLQPSIALADGFPATVGWCAAVERSAEVFGADGDWARTFRPRGRPWRSGETVSLPALAATLRRLAGEGPAVAYQGVLARRSADYLTAAGSPLRYGDFAGHRSDWTAPMAIAYRGLTSLSHPPNSSGATALQILGLLDRFTPSYNDARWIDLGLRASRIALGDRDALLTDPRAMAPGTIDELLDPSRLDGLAARLADRREPDQGTVPAPAGDTIFLAAADDGGSMVSLIESNFRGFGSGLVDPQTGISFQNRGASFSLDPAHVNVLAPQKRTLHTLTPGMLMRNGRPWVAHGAMGGAIQPQVFAQLVSAVVDGGLDIAAAVAAPRWALGSAYRLGQFEGATLEERFEAAIRSGLESLGQPVSTVEPFSSLMGHANAVAKTDEGFVAASDPRCEGAGLAW